MPALLGQWKVPKTDFTMGVMSPETPEAVIFLETVINLDQNRTHVIKRGLVCPPHIPYGLQWTLSTAKSTQTMFDWSGVEWSGVHWTGQSTWSPHGLLSL